MTRTTTPVASARPRRASLGVRNRLSVKNQDEKFVYRIVNDIDDRVELLQEQGYEIVPKDKAGTIGDKRVDNASALGSTAHIPVGQGTKALVMRIPKEYYAEDQAAKQADIDAMESTMYGDAKKKSDYGTFTVDK